LSVDFSEKTFEVLDALDRHEVCNQRQLAKHAGISLGQANYILRILLDKGLVKLGNFRSRANRIGYMYLLTSKGMYAKSLLAAKFVPARLAEYHKLRTRLAEKLDAVEKRGCKRIAFVGPEAVKDFVEKVITESGLGLSFINGFRTWDELKGTDAESFDTALLFDGSPDSMGKISEATGIPKAKLQLLW
jgi:EPS-associated MarR family transcriptional regulator